MKHLTSTNPGLEKLVQATPPGMAHWAGTGLAGAVCGQCLHHCDIEVGSRKRVKRNRGFKFYRMMGRLGHVVPPNTPACRYFEVG
jgi:hypothetical protein